jgi:alkaline phosphatase
VTTADVFDATPAANAVYTADRGAGTGIVDQYFDDRELTGLRVLMGGGRKWFLPNASDRIDPQPANGSQRRGATDYVLSAAIASAWHAAGGSLDSGRDLLRDFSQAGYAYAPDAAALQVAAQSAQKLLGLFALSNMNAAADKIAGRRGTSGVTADFGFPNQPMLDEMTRAALGVLAKNPRGFFLLVEGASIDKQSHAMDSDRWILEVIEFDRAVRVAKEFAQKHPDTLVVVTADHECSGAAIIGASLLTNQQLQARAATPGIGAGSAERAGLRAGVVGVYDSAGFPRYTLAGDGYPVRTDVDRKLLIGYAANADRYEDWVANAKPLLDGQQPFAPELARQGYAQSALDRDRVGEFLVTGQVDGGNAAHTGTDIPLSAFGRGSEQFHGVIDNTDVFFMMAAAAAGGRYHKEADP